MDNFSFKLMHHWMALQGDTPDNGSPYHFLNRPHTYPYSHTCTSALECFDIPAHCRSRYLAVEHIPIFLRDMNYYGVSNLDLRRLRKAEKHCRKSHEISPRAIILLLPDEDPEIALQSFNAPIDKRLIEEPEAPILVFAGYTVSEKGRDVLARHRSRKVLPETISHLHANS
ncbi:hypothetical protein [Chromobacterium haemolyticum]|uniref:hypothetical protein n=1 Tax=Chromobacterium haemolyticum TaxID=394935 RepID=UPI0012DC0C20|nr:hypothetical protein [Chromobacterium haemolyticum]